MMNIWIVTIGALELVGFTQAANSLKVDYQAEFSWNIYRKLSTNFKQNTVISPYSHRKIFACLQELTIPCEDKCSMLNRELEIVLLLKQKYQLPELIRTRYSDQWKAYEKERALNVTTVATVIGREKLCKTFKKLSKNCSIHIRSLRPSSSKQMGRIMNTAMRTISNNSVKGFFNDSDIDLEWDFFVAESWKFEGMWKYEFDEEATTTCNFYASKNEIFLMRFMYLEETLKYGYFPQWSTVAVEMPFHDKSPFSCVFMMPIGVNIETLIKTLNHTRFRDIYMNMRASKTTIRLPQFKLGLKLTVKSILKSMGLNVPFNEAVFRVHDQKEPVSLGNIIQKVEIVMGTKGNQPAKPYYDRKRGNEFTAHRPFVFVVFDRTALVPVMIGHLVKPIFQEKNLTESDERLCDYPPKNFYP